MSTPFEGSDPCAGLIPRESMEEAVALFAYPDEVPKLARLARAFLPEPARMQLSDVEVLFAAIERLAECLHYLLADDDPVTQIALFAVYCEPWETILAWRETLCLPAHIHVALIDLATMNFPC